MTVPVSPSSTLTLLIASVGARSSFVIVPVPVAVAIVALVGPDNVTVNVSFASYSVSPTTGTVIVPVVAPTAIVRIPLVVAV